MKTVDILKTREVCIPQYSGSSGMQMMARQVTVPRGTEIRRPSHVMGMCRAHLGGVSHTDGKRSDKDRYLLSRGRSQASSKVQRMSGKAYSIHRLLEYSTMSGNHIVLQQSRHSSETGF